MKIGLVLHFFLIQVFELENQRSQTIFKWFDVRDKFLVEILGQKMRIRYQRIGLVLVVIMGEGNAVWHLDSESKVFVHRFAVLGCNFLVRQLGWMTLKKRPEPLIYLHGLIPLSVLLKKVNSFGDRINQATPGRILPATRSYSELGHINPYALRELGVARPSK